MLMKNKYIFLPLVTTKMLPFKQVYAFPVEIPLFDVSDFRRQSQRGITTKYASRTAENSGRFCSN